MQAAEPEKPLDVAAAHQAIFAAISPIEGWEMVPIRAALGRITFHDIIAPFDVPPHDNSAMDGYAIRAADLTVGGDTSLEIIGTALAGHPFKNVVASGQAVRIMTGAPMPQGADTVVMQEVVSVSGKTVSIPPGQTAGQNVRRAGEDLARDQAALPAGKRIGPAELGLIASLGLAEIAVYRRLRVAFFSTGDELASLGQSTGQGQIYDSNRYTLYGLLAGIGAEAIDLGVIRDDPRLLEEAFERAASQADVVITSGGVSVGEADFIKDLLARLGKVKFWKINIKPGKPMAFGRLRNAWFFGLPGNPVSVMVTYHQFVSAALQRLMGVHPLPPRPTFAVPSLSAIRKPQGRREYVRGLLTEEDGVWKVRQAGSQSSGVLRSMSEANCFIVLPENCSGVAAGDLVQVQPFAGL